jgi:hypothetical protein
MSHLFDRRPDVGDLKDSLREVARRCRLRGIDDELVEAIANGKSDPSVTCFEKAGLDGRSPTFST